MRNSRPSDTLDSSECCNIENSKTQQMETITAVITTFRRPKTLRRAINSVFTQKTLPDELLVIDNADDAETKETVLSFGSFHQVSIRYIVEKKSGASAARNRGIKEAECDYIAFLDDDDVWLTNHLDDFKNIKKGRSGISVFSGMLGRLANPSELILPSSRELFNDYSLEQNGELSIRKATPLIRPFFTPSMSVSVINTFFARDILFDEELLGREDIYFVWRLGTRGDIILHNRLHGLADQLETSLFSVMDHAKTSERLRMDLKKAYYGVLMLEKVIETSSPTAELTEALAQAHFDSAYTNAMAGNTKIAFEHLVRSARIRPKFQHLRLAARVALSPLRNIR